MNYRRAHIENSKIFITIVTSKRRPILIENIDLLRNSFKQAKEKIKFEIVCRLGFNPTVCSLGFNPTETIEIAEKRVA